MIFKDSLISIYDLLYTNPDNLRKINGKTFKYSHAFKYIYENIENIIGKNTHDDIILTGIQFDNCGPHINYITNHPFLSLSTCIIGSRITLPIQDEQNPFFFVWHLAHEMVHAFITIKDNKITSSYDSVSVLEEGLATYMAKLLYFSYFKYLDIPHPKIINNNFKYDNAEDIYINIIKCNNDIFFIKKIREINPSLKNLKKENFKNIIIPDSLTKKAIANF